MTFGWGLLPRSSSRPAVVHMADSLGQLNGAQDHSGVGPPRSNSSSRLTERGKVQAGDSKGLSAALLLLQQQQLAEDSKPPQSPMPRTSADCVIEGARCTSDPSYSNRPSMDIDADPTSASPCDSRREALPHRRRGVDFDATSAPASARASLDVQHAAATAAAAAAAAAAEAVAAAAGGPTDSAGSSPTYTSCASPLGSIDSASADAGQPPSTAAAVLAARLQEAAGGSGLCSLNSGSSSSLQRWRVATQEGTSHATALGPTHEGPPASQACPILTPRGQQLLSSSLDLRPPGGPRGSFVEATFSPCEALPPGIAVRGQSFWASAAPSSCPDGGGLLASTVQAEQEHGAAGLGPRAGEQRGPGHISPFQLAPERVAMHAETPPCSVAQPPLVHAPLPRSVVLQHLQLQQQQHLQQQHHPTPLHLPQAPQPPQRPAHAVSPPVHLPPVCEGQPATSFPSPMRHPHTHAPQPRRITAAAALLAALQQEAPAGLGGGIVRSLPATRAPSAEIHDPMLGVHGAYGCHLMPEQQQAPLSHATSLADAIQTAVAQMGGGQRSSIDLLLDPLPPTTSSRRSMELLLSAPSSRRSAATSLGAPRLSLDSTGSREGFQCRRNSITVAMLPRDGRSSSAAFMTPQSRGPLHLSKTATGSFANLEVLGMLPHAASTNAISDMTGSQEMLVPSTPTAASAAAMACAYGSLAGLGVGTTASAYASSVVDTSGHHLAGAFDGELREKGEPYSGQGGLSQELWLDPDLHDTFGAHAMAPPAPAAPAPASDAGGSASGGSAAASPRGRHDTLLGGSSGKQVSFRAAPTGRRSLSPSATAAAAAAGARPTAMLDPSAVQGQHSVTVSDPLGTVPSLEFLRQRKVARQKLEQYSSRGGYIAEAKRVLSQAMSTADPLETLLVQSSESGAIGPLLRHLSQVKGDDEALRSGLHTLSLIISNSPNRGIIMNFRGQQMLFDILSTTRDLEVQENIIQLLWDLESEAMGAARKDCKPDLKCMDALLGILERTRSASIASHVIHFMHSFTHLPVPGELLADASRRLVAVVEAYRYHLQDAAQYTLGQLLTSMLEDPAVAQQAVLAAAEGLIQLLQRPRHNMQCQAVLTLLSCIASGQRSRDALCRLQARAKLLQFGQHVADPRLRARALSLVKVLNKQEMRSGAAVAAVSGGGGGMAGGGGMEARRAPEALDH